MPGALTQVRVEAYLRDPHERALGNPTALRHLDVRWHSSAARAIKAARQPATSALLVEISSFELGDDEPILPLLQEADLAIPILFRLHLSRANAYQLAGCALSGISGRVSLRGYDSLTTDLSRLAEQTEPITPELVILRRLVDVVPYVAFEIVAATLCVGRRRAYVNNVASHVGIAVRTLEWRLARAKMPSAKDLLRWALLLHATWGLEHHGRRLKQVAASAGFSSTPAFTNFVRRNSGISPTKLREPGSFVELLRQYACRLSFKNGSKG